MCPQELRRAHSAGKELADGLMRHAEQDADVALGQALILQVPSGESRLRCGIRAHPLSLLAGIPGSAHFFGRCSPGSSLTCRYCGSAPVATRQST